MKQSSLLALMLAGPLAALGQNAVFTDTFTNGSTFNGVSTPGGSPTASATSYDFSSSKTAVSSIGANGLIFGLSAATTSGFVEGQAVFTLTPVALNTVGDYIDLSYVFSGTNLLAGGTSSAIFTGLYNSGGFKPVAGTAGTQGNAVSLNTTPGYVNAANNAANWQGYVVRMVETGGTLDAYTRPIQNAGGTSSANQDLIGNNLGGGAYNNPAGSLIGGTTASTVTLTNGAAYLYTMDYRLTLSDVGVLTITESLYGGAGTNGTQLATQSVTTTTALLTNSFDGLAIGVRNSGTSFQPTIQIRQLAVSKSIYGTPGPGFNLTGGGAGCPGDGYLLTLSGSVTTNTYWLYTNGVYDAAVAVQTGTGNALTFGPISVVGTNTILASNTVSGFTGLMNGAPVISILPAPTIGTEPVAATVATNYAATFSVATATASTFGYQWYRNGVALTDGGHISGSQTAILTIAPATTADVATVANGYSVIITNHCGLSATSAPPAALTLSAPVSVVWQGGNPNNNWDLATTLNFINSSATPVVFLSGDTVTLDDTSANPIVTLVGTNLEPSVLVENAGQPYFINGTGVISGPGALVMNGTGSLSISNVNTYSGGTTLSNGTLVVDAGSQQSLGSGPVNFAGGALQYAYASGNASGVSNNFNVTANSTLQYNGAGTYGFVFYGGLNGSPAAALTVQNYLNNSATPDRLRLYGAFTNNAQIIINSAGNTVDLAPYNAAGSQVYNSLISGNGGRILARGAGNVIFNAANTFNDSGVANNGAGPSGYSFIFSGGNVGVGADSTATSPGVVTASPLGTGIVGIDTTLGNFSLFANGGAHVLANEIIYTSATNSVQWTINGSYNLTLAGPIYLNGADNSGGTNRNLQINNTGVTIISGVIQDQGLNCGLVKSGTNTLYLNATNTYGGSTTVTNGTLAGTGVISGPVTVLGTGSIAGGGATAIGALTISNNVTLGGNVVVRLNKALAPAQSNDVIVVTGTLANSGSGTVTVTNLGAPALKVGDRFPLFSEPVASGSTLTVTGGGVTWTNHLAIDGSIVVLSVGSNVATNATNITYSVSGGNLVLNWPVDHTGWRLQTQTNTLAVGLSSNWVDVPGSTNVHTASFPINAANGAVFYRMLYP